MKKNFVKSRWLFTMLLFVTTMIMPSMMWAKSISPTRPNGEGTAENPYQIGTREELYWFARLVNGKLENEKKNTSANAILTADIIVNEGVLDAVNKGQVSDFIEWEPIGTSNIDDNAYSGTFDGNKHTISGLYFDKTRSYQVGLFGYIGAKGKLFNVGVLDSYFQFSAEGGGVCGVNYGELQNCSNSSTVIGTEKRANIGGVCGTNFGTVRDCKNTGSVSGQYFVGGVCGYNYKGPITNCYYLSGTVPDGKDGIGGNDESGKAVEMSKEHFESGEVAWLLNGSTSAPTEGSTLAWYQKLGENGDAYPVLTSTGENTVYEAYHHGEKDRFFSNTVANQHSVAYNTEAEDEANGNHDLSYEAGEYTWTEAEDKTQVPSVAVTYTCKVCGKTEKPQMTVVHDAEHDDVEATCTEDGHKYYKTSYTFNAKAIFSNAYTQTLTALGHNMSEDVTFNDSKSIYQKGCTRADCDYHDYYATSDGSIEAKPNDDASAFTVEAFTLNDATVYNSKAEFTVKELTYNRTFKHDGWQAVYVPFELKCDQIPADYEVATINNFHEFEQKDGSFNTVLEVKPVKNSITIPALTPCLIRLKQAPETAEAKTLQFTNVSFAAAADKKIDCASVTRYYQFLGTLNAKTGFDTTSDFVINEGELWKTGSDTKLNPQRWYLNASNREGSLLNPSVQLSRIAIHVIGGDETTGIDGIYVKPDTEDVSSSRQGIYDLQGRKLSVEPTSGIYIKDGKKYVK